MQTFFMFLLCLFALFSIIMMIIQRGTIRSLKDHRDTALRLYENEQRVASNWRAESRRLQAEISGLRKKHAKPAPKDTKPVKNGRPTSPLQDKLDSMVGAVSSRRLSPVKHAPNIQPQRRDEDATTIHMLNGAVVGTVLTGGSGINDSDLKVEGPFSWDATPRETHTPDPTPSPSHDSSPSYDSGSSGSSDSGSFGGGDSGSF